MGLRPRAVSSAARYAPPSRDSSHDGQPELLHRCADHCGSHPPRRRPALGSRARGTARRRQADGTAHPRLADAGRLCRPSARRHLPQALCPHAAQPACRAPNGNSRIGPLSAHLTDAFIRQVKATGRADGGAEILLPGERGFREQEARLRHGIPIDDDTWGRASPGSSTTSAWTGCLRSPADSGSDGLRDLPAIEAMPDFATEPASGDELLE